MTPEATRKSIQAAISLILSTDKNATLLEMDQGYQQDVVSGVGFGYKFYTKLKGEKPKDNFTLATKRGPLGVMPSTGGDVFVQAKSSSLQKLHAFALKIKSSLPAKSVQQFKQIFGFDYQHGRDLSGFVDGTENPSEPEERVDVAVDKSTGGSYCITQEWIHDFNVIMQSSDATLEQFVGRTKLESDELRNKSITSHVARMTSGPEYGAPSPFQMVRQSLPFAYSTGEAGLFFIGFAASTDNFEYMLNRMVGAVPDGLSDDIMKISRCVSGNYWYFPPMQELTSLAMPNN